jgi:hypothetical protein
VDGGKPVMRHPKSVAALVTLSLSGLLAMGRDFANYGGLLYERIGRIKVLVDGEPFEEWRSEWDITDLLAESRYRDWFGALSSSYPQDKRKVAYKEWLRKTYGSRVEFGLPVKPNVEEQESLARSK